MFFFFLILFFIGAEEWMEIGVHETSLYEALPISLENTSLPLQVLNAIDLQTIGAREINWQFLIYFLLLVSISLRTSRHSKLIHDSLRTSKLQIVL